MSNESPVAAASPQGGASTPDALAVQAARTRRVVAVCGGVVTVALVVALLTPLTVQRVESPVLQPKAVPVSRAAAQASPLAFEAFDAPLWTVALPPPPPPKPTEPPPAPPLACELIGIEGNVGEYRAVVYDTAADALRSLRVGDVISQRVVREVRKDAVVLEFAGAMQTLSLDDAASRSAEPGPRTSQRGAP